MKTILITGCSSGFGLDAARHFLERGWSVIATMRVTDATLFPASENLKLLPLDVTNAASIADVVAAAGEVDVLVNNAGIGLLGPLEGTSMDMVRSLFETNCFGTIAMTQAFLPQMRERRSGIIINITSAVTLVPMPLLSVYSASKSAVNMFTESVAFELEPFGVRAILVLPGRAPTTSFSDTARARLAAQGGVPDAYSEIVAGIFKRSAEQPADKTTHEKEVTDAIWRAATDSHAPGRIPAGADAEELAGRG